MYVLRTGHFYVTKPSVILDINFYPVIKVSHATGYFYQLGMSKYCLYPTESSIGCNNLAYLAGHSFLTLKYLCLAHAISFSNHGITQKQIVVAHSNKRQNKGDMVAF